MWLTKVKHEVEIKLDRIEIMDMYIYTERKELKCRAQRNLWTETVSLQVKKGRLRCLGHMECKHDAC